MNSNLCAQVTSEAVQCSICLGENTIDARPMMVHNRHFFHRECLLTWLRGGKNSCPVCREELSPEWVVNILPEDNSGERLRLHHIGRAEPREICYSVLKHICLTFIGVGGGFLIATFANSFQR